MLTFRRPAFQPRTATAGHRRGSRQPEAAEIPPAKLVIARSQVELVVVDARTTKSRTRSAPDRREYNPEGHQSGTARRKTVDQEYPSQPRSGGSGWRGTDRGTENISTGRVVPESRSTVMVRLPAGSAESRISSVSPGRTEVLEASPRTLAIGRMRSSGRILAIQNADSSLAFGRGSAISCGPHGLWGPCFPR